MTSTTSYQALATELPSEDYALQTLPAPTQHAVEREPLPSSEPIQLEDTDPSSTSLATSTVFEHAPSEEMPNQASVRESDYSITEAEFVQPKQSQEENLPSQKHTPKKPDLWSRLVADWWVLEVTAAILSLAAIFSVVGVLLAFDQKPVPLIYRGVTLNAIISILATTSRAGILMCAGTALSQLKWLSFGNQQNLLNLQKFENASRGPAGSFVLLCSHYRGVTTYIAALAIVGTLAFEPFIQQLVTTQYRMVSRPSSDIFINAHSGTTGIRGPVWNKTSEEVAIQLNALLSIVALRESRTWRSSNGRNPIMPKLQSFLSSIQANCPHGNCTWPIYQTTDVCSKCQDTTKSTIFRGLMSDPTNVTQVLKHGWAAEPFVSLWEIQPMNGNSVIINATIGYNSSQTSTSKKGELVTNSVYQISWPLNVADISYHHINRTGWTPQIFAEIEAPQIALGYAEFSMNTMTGFPTLKSSMECAFAYCVREYNVSMADGILVSSIRPIRFLNLTDWYTEGNGSDVETHSYWVGDGIDVLAKFLLGHSRINYYFECPSANNSKCDVRERLVFPEAYSPEHWAAIGWPANFSAVVESSSAAVSAILQQHGDVTIPGLQQSTEPFTVVRWRWLAYPLSIILLGAVATGLTVWETHRSGAPLWKSSILPLLYRYQHNGPGVDEQKLRISERDVAEEPRTLSKNSDLKSDLVSRFEVRAESMLARLSKDGLEDDIWMLHAKDKE